MMLENKYKTQGAKKGFTLIELLLYVLISAMIISSVAVFLFLIFQSREKNQTVMEVESQGDYIMQIVTQTIRNSEGINSPSQATSSATLSLDVVDGSFDPTVFYVSGGVFQVTEGVSGAVALSNSKVIVSDLSFYNLSRTGTYGVVRVQFTVSRINPENRNEYDYSETFYGSASLRQ